MDHKFDDFSFKFTFGYHRFAF